MKISLNWLKKYVNIPLDNSALEKLIDSRLVEIEEAIDETHKYDNIFVVKVISCEPIEGTHLHLCQIDAGGASRRILWDSPAPTGAGCSEARPVTTGAGERVPKDTAEALPVQVVCGAPNVHSGMLTAWIAPGATVPASVHDDAPFVIGTRKMLGKYESHGMLAGADELDLGDDHSGIVEIDPEQKTIKGEKVKPGDRLADVFDLDDVILDIENKSLTHRPDCFGLIGFAREVAGIMGQKFDGPTWAQDYSASLEASKPKIQISDSNLCPRYSAIILKKRSDLGKKYLSLQDAILAKSGMRPVDPIVDATNYLMLLTGQPLHAFDYDKFLAVGGTSEPKIGVRLAKKGEKLTLLDDKEIDLVETDIVITSNDVPVALAGAMGGKSTMIDSATKNIILESATFSLYNLRKTQMAHGIFSEAITRFTKGQPAYQTLSVAKQCADLLSNAFEISEVLDSGFTPTENVVKFTTSDVNSLLGTNFSTKDIIETLSNVGIAAGEDESSDSSFWDSPAPTGAGCSEASPATAGASERVPKTLSELAATIPLWRTDLSIREDIIEEIGRLTGYDNIEKNLPLHSTPSKNPLLTLKTQIRNILSAARAHELLTYTFIHGDLLQKVGESPENSYKIVNSISPDLQYLRQSIAPSLLQKAQENLKNHHDNFALFEMNQVFAKTAGLDAENVPIAKNHLALVAVSTVAKTNFYLAKKYLEELAKELNIKLALSPCEKSEFPYFEPKRSAKILLGEKTIGTLGEIKQKVAKNLKLPTSTAAFELDLDALNAAEKDHKKSILSSDFPFVSRDLTVETEKTHATIVEKISQILTAKNLVFQISPVSIYQAANQNPKLSFHLDFSDPEKTLDAAQILEIMQELEKIH